MESTAQLRKELAAQKLQKMSKKNFIGIEKEIIGLSRLYDMKVLKYLGKKTVSVPARAESARKSRNWKHFRMLYHLLETLEVPASEYLDFIFQSFDKTVQQKLKMCYPYPNALYGQWAVNSFEWYLADRKAKQVDLSEDEYATYRKELESSYKYIQKLCLTDNLVPRIYHIVAESDSLSPIFLAFDLEYITLVTERDLEVSEEVERLLTRASHDDTFRVLIMTMLKEIKHECRNL